MDDYDDSVDMNDNDDQQESIDNDESIISISDDVNIDTSQVEEWDLNSYVNEVQNDIVSHYGGHMDNLSFMMDDMSHKTFSYSEKDYTELYGHNSLAHHELEDNSIHIINENKEVAMHSSAHELFHASAYQNHTIDSNEEGIVETYKSGVLEIHQLYDENGNKIAVEETGRGLNEGMTEMFTIGYLDGKGEYEASMSINSYQENVSIAKQLNELVGEDIMCEAYFNGDKESLANEVNMYAKNDQAFQELNQQLDIINNSKIQAEREAALARIDEMMTEMQANKLEMEEIE